MKTDILIDSIQFAEGLRWREGKLWFCDLWAKRVYTVDPRGLLQCVLSLDDEPVALGWLRDGSLLVMSLYRRELQRYEEGRCSLYADLSMSAPGYAHDFTVSKDNNVYVSVSGFYPRQGVKPVTSSIYCITPQQEVRMAASNIRYPNGIQLLNNQGQLVVSETFAAAVSILEVGKDSRLSNRQEYLAFDDKGFSVAFDAAGVPIDLNRYYPDGLCVDERRGCLWVACPGRNEVLAITPGGIKARISARAIPFDCAIDSVGNTLFIGSSNANKSNPKGQIECCDISHVG